jgi:hypothetical protein
MNIDELARRARELADLAERRDAAIAAEREAKTRLLERILAAIGPRAATAMATRVLVAGSGDAGALTALRKRVETPASWRGVRLAGIGPDLIPEDAMGMRGSLGGVDLYMAEDCSLAELRYAGRWEKALFPAPVNPNADIFATLDAAADRFRQLSQWEWTATTESLSSEQAIARGFDPAAISTRLGQLVEQHLGGQSGKTIQRATLTAEQFRALAVLVPRSKK